MGQPQDAKASDARFEVVADKRPAAAVKYYRLRDYWKYQHYRDRNPPWVKLYGEQIDDYEFQQLPDSSRFHFLALTWLASKTGNKIPNDPVWVARRINAHDPVNLSILFDAGFLEPWQPRLQEPGPGEQLALPEPEAVESVPIKPADGTVSADASKLLASCYQDASNLLAQRQSTETETEAEAHTETDTAPASAVRLCGCCGASVCSEFSYSDALTLARKWKSEGRQVGGRRIENPGGLARTLHREGTADEEIRLLLRPPPRREFTDEACPACLGAKMQVTDKGAKKCPVCVDEAGQRTGKKPKDSPRGRSP